MICQISIETFFTINIMQERLQHYIDQVEVSIAGQVASKSHHFFQVMTYHDALMCQVRGDLSFDDNSLDSSSSH